MMLRFCCDQIPEKTNRRRKGVFADGFRGFRAPQALLLCAGEAAWCSGVYGEGAGAKIRPLPGHS